MIFTKPVYATCPVCVVAVGGGLWLAEKLGVDDLLAAIWIGALVTALAVWWGSSFKLLKLPRPKFSWSIIFYLLTIAILYLQGKINQPYCRIWGICKVWLGITVGTVVFLLGVGLDRFLRSKNQGRAFFPLQKVVIPLIMVILVTLGFWRAIC